MQFKICVCQMDLGWKQITYRTKSACVGWIYGGNKLLAEQNLRMSNEFRTETNYLQFKICVCRMDLGRKQITCKTKFVDRKQVRRWEAAFS